MRIFKILVALLFLTACYKENEEDLFAEQMPPPAPVIPADTSKMDSTVSTAVSFAKDIQPLMDSKCSTSGCHVPMGRGAGQFRDYAEISQRSPRIKVRAIDQRDMPGRMPETGSPQLSDKQFNDLKSWIDNGTPNN